MWRGGGGQALVSQSAGAADVGMGPGVWISVSVRLTQDLYTHLPSYSGDTVMLLRVSMATTSSLRVRQPPPHTSQQHLTHRCSDGAQPHPCPEAPTLTPKT